jgi:hypothetical protein
LRIGKSLFDNILGNRDSQDEDDIPQNRLSSPLRMLSQLRFLKQFDWTPMETYNDPCYMSKSKKHGIVSCLHWRAIFVYDHNYKTIMFNVSCYLWHHILQVPKHEHNKFNKYIPHRSSLIFVDGLCPSCTFFRILLRNWNLPGRLGNLPLEHPRSTRLNGNTTYWRSESRCHLAFQAQFKIPCK